MSTLPNFIKPGASGLESLNRSKFLKIESGKPLEIIPLTGIEPPPGEEPNGRNCVISFNQYTLWIDADKLPEGKFSPSFPAIGGKYDPGALLGLEPRFRAMMLVMVRGDEEEYILPFSISVFRQLVEIEQALGQSIRGQVLRITRTGDGLKTKYRVVTTGKFVEIEGEPDTNLLDYIGPTTREEIVQLLTEVGHWPPPGGDPMLKEGANGKSATKPAAETKVEEDEDDDSAPWDDDELEHA